MNTFHIISISEKPNNDSDIVAVNLRKQEGGNWRWLEPGRTHTFYGTNSVDWGDGWTQVVPDKGSEYSLWFKPFGVWCKKNIALIRDVRTDEEALRVIESAWQQEIDNGG